MTEILVAAVNAAALIAVAFIANRSRQHAKAARQQVQNSHSINLRDDLDKQFAVIHKRLDAVHRRLDNVEHPRSAWWRRLKG